MKLHQPSAKVSLLMTGSPYFNRQTLEFVLSSEHWRVTLLDSSQINFKPLYVPVFIKALLQNDLWYSCGGIGSWRAAFLCRIAVALGLPTVIHWIGTDVLNYQTYAQKHPGIVNIVRHVSHWATAPWLVEELSQLGIEATLVPFASQKRKNYLSLPPPEFPKHFTVLTTIPGERLDFYGWENILKLAHDFPEITFNVLRATGEAIKNKPVNLNFLGWVEDTFEVYKNSTVAVRMTKHDGYSGSIQEPLALGRYAIWTYPFPGALIAKDYQTLHSHVADLLLLHKKGLLKTNEEGRQFIKQNLNPDRLARNFESALYRFVRGRI
jgi:hypothetical protein